MTTRSTLLMATLLSQAVLLPAGSAVAQHPDFSGIWLHPFWPGFDPPLSGPGPVVNKLRLPNGIGNWRVLVGDYTNPILKPDAAEIVRKQGDISLTGVVPQPTNVGPNPCPTFFGI
jgi:hypothetical protein